MEKIRLAVIGLGCRGKMLLDGVLLKRKDVSVEAVCDLYEDRTEAAAAAVKKADDKAQVRCYSSDRRLFAAESGRLDAVIIASSWDAHIRQAIMALEAGVPTALEVGGAYSIKELWELIDTYEKYQTPFMFLENCCYGRDELMLLNMVRQGVFGEIVHCDGGYQHDLRDEIAGGIRNRHYRLDNYQHRNAENYPTHELGPIARLLNINHGNRILSLCSMAGKAAGLDAYLEKHKEEYPEVYGRSFRQGDIVTTLLSCAGGETIRLTLDTTLPRYYSRGLCVHGTRGFYCEDNHSIFLDDNAEHHKADFAWKEQWGNAEKYRASYEHPIWQKFLADEVRGGHGGMDWLVLDAFFEALRAGGAMPIDVYDAAVWMAVTALSEESVALGGQVLPFPDFTNGRWIKS